MSCPEIKILYCLGKFVWYLIKYRLSLRVCDQMSCKKCIPLSIFSTSFLSCKFSAVITPHASSFVHHMIVYLCTAPLTEDEVGVSEPCNDISDESGVSICRRASLFGAWAVGGEVSGWNPTP